MTQRSSTTLTQIAGQRREEGARAERKRTCEASMKALKEWCTCRAAHEAAADTYVRTSECGRLQRSMKENDTKTTRSAAREEPTRPGRASDAGCEDLGPENSPGASRGTPTCERPPCRHETPWARNEESLSAGLKRLILTILIIVASNRCYACFSDRLLRMH